MADHGNTRLRSDAQRNREHILRIAHDALAESGATSLNEIAKRAGVGPGTLYRHFPTREALILAVYQHDIERLVDSVPRVLAANAPLDAFRRGSVPSPTTSALSTDSVKRCTLRQSRMRSTRPTDRSSPRSASSSMRASPMAACDQA